MKFTVNSKEFLKALKLVKKIIPARSHLYVLENALLKLEENVLTVTGTDLNHTIITKIDVRGSKNGRVVILPKLIIDTLEHSPDTTVTIELEEPNIILKTLAGKYTISTIPAEEFPTAIEITGKANLPIKSEMFHDINNTVVFAASNEELRPAMCGVYMQFTNQKTVSVVATNGYILSNKVFNHEENIPEQSHLLTTKFIDVIQELRDDISIATDGKKIQASNTKTIIIGTLISEKYPNWNAVVPVIFSGEIEIRNYDLKSALHRIINYSDVTYNQVTLNILNDKKNLLISGNDNERGYSANENLTNIKITKFNEPEMKITFNGNYFSEVLDTFDNEEIIKIQYNRHNTPVIISPVDEKKNRFVLLMPINQKQT